MSKLISIIIPCKNGENYLREAVEGIRKQEMNVEIIVVDDGSTDGTAKLADSLGCKVVLHGVSRGQVAGKNTGIKSATGDYIMFHDHDDVMREGALSRLASELESDTSACAVMAKVQDFFTSEMPDEEKAKTAIKEEPYYGLFTGAVLMRKEVFDVIGMFGENVHAGEIIEWSSKLQQHSLVLKKVDFVSTSRRIHATNFGKTSAKTEYRDYASILRAKLKR